MFYTEEKLKEFGFKSLGKNVLISDKCSIYGAHNISIGNNVRIDDFVVISTSDGDIEIGDYVHIAIHASIQGEGKILLDDFSGLSSRVAIYSSNADYLGDYLTNPNVPIEHTNTSSGDVLLHKHALIGCGAVVMPGVTLYEGAVVGALSFVKKNCEAFTIYAGNPLKKIKERNRGLLDHEKMMIIKGQYEIK